MEQPTNNADAKFEGVLGERFSTLPKVVQDAITSAGIQEHLRTLANTHKLHLDQWQLLENEVMLTLLGFQPPEELKDNIKKDIEVSDEVAGALAADISHVVFDPIREELERELDHPEAQAKSETNIEKMTAQALESREAAPAPLAAPATAPETKAVRAPISEVYKPGETSSARKDVVNDPYRESPV